MIYLQSFNFQQYLFYLVGFGFSLMILNIDSKIPLPWGFVNSMTTPALTGLTEEMVAYLAEIVKSNVSGILLYLGKDMIYIGHIKYSIITGIIAKGCSLGSGTCETISYLSCRRSRPLGRKQGGFNFVDDPQGMG
jgi:hypothetical protein